MRWVYDGGNVLRYDCRDAYTGAHVDVSCSSLEADFGGYSYRIGSEWTT